MSEFEPFSYFSERQRRMKALALRLKISPEQPDEIVWSFIGQVLAQREVEFRDFALFDGYSQPRAGAPIKDELSSVLLAERVAAHMADFPDTATITAALVGLGFGEHQIPSAQKAVSEGRRILRERARLEEQRRLSYQERLRRGRRKKPISE